MSTEVVMPQMGESIAEGTITKWLKQVGEHVERDEPLFEISTDKVDAEIPSPAAGTLNEIRLKEGETVEINTTVAVLDGGATAGAAPAAAASTETAAKESEPEQKQSEVTAAKAQSAEIRAETPQAQPAVKAEVTQPKAAAIPTSQEPAAQKPAVARKETAPQSGQATGNGGSATATAEELRRTKSSPLVRKIAQEHGVDIARLEGTGMSGRVTKNDILSFIESGAPAGAPARTTQASSAIQEPAAATAAKSAEGDRVEQMTVMRKKIAEHMVV